MGKRSTRKERTSNKTFAILLVIVLISSAIAYLGYVFYIFIGKDLFGEKTGCYRFENAENDQNDDLESKTEDLEMYKDWKEYKNPKYGYSFMYPSGVTVWQYKKKDCSGEKTGCIPVESEGDVVGIEINDELLYLQCEELADRMLCESHSRSSEDEQIDNIKFGNYNGYAIFTYEGSYKERILTGVVFDYWYENHEETEGIFRHLYVEEFHTEENYSFKVNLGYAGKNKLTEREFEEFEKILGTLIF